jgi:hypothetical protein
MISTSTSPSNTIRLNGQKKISVTPVLYGQEVAGWITSTQTSDGVIYYGPFATTDEAVAWAQNLISAVVEPVYHPSFNRG